jgi:D-alanine-D-alanine ligase
MDRKLRVAVVFGGRSGEHEVSLVSATSVIQALDPHRYEVVPVGISRDGRWLSSADTLALLKTRAPLDEAAECYLAPEPTRRALVGAAGSAGGPPIDVVFPLVHGTGGEDGSLQGLLELAAIPYVGAGVIGSALGMDKILQKKLFADDGLPVARYAWFLSNDVARDPRGVVRTVEEELRYPVFVKPANTGSSVGISKAHDGRELRTALAVAVQYDRKVIVEQGVKNAREIEVSVLGNDDPAASIPGEIIPSNEFYDYDAKYVDGKSRAVVPAELRKKTAKELQRLAVRAFRALDCAGMARVDFFLQKKTDRIVLNEINTIPGFTSISMYPKLWEASGLTYPKLLDRLIELALERHAEKAALRTTYDPKTDWFAG